MFGKKPIGVGLIVALVALSVTAFSAPSAGAVACTGNILCSGGGAGAKLRDDFDEPPVGGKFGADILAVNTKAALRLRIPGVFENSNPTGYAFFGLKLDKNPVTGCGAGNEFATGWVEFADVQHASASAVYSGTGPVAGAGGGKGPWPFKIRSDKCATEPGVVTIENVNLYFTPANVTAAGTVTGVYEQPGANCAGGGVKLNIAQPGLGAGREIDNAAGGNAFLCFVSSNNVLFPTTAPTWTPLTGSIWKD